MVNSNILSTTPNREIVERMGPFALLEYKKDISVSPLTAQLDYFAAEMGLRKRQLVVNLFDSGVITQVGAMQWVSGRVEAATNIKGVGDFAKKLIGSKVTGESAVKPRYVGTGTITLEPTYKFVLFEDVGTWNGGMVIEDGHFYACEDTVETRVVPRGNVSSAVLGGEGLFNTKLIGAGVVALESPVPRDELIVFELENESDVVKIDGNMAIAWSNSLDFTVERTTKTLIGSAASGEGLVNVFRGKGKILMAPVANNTLFATPFVNQTPSSVQRQR